MIAFDSPLERAEVDARWHRAGGRRRRADAAAGRIASSTAPACTRLPWRTRFAGRDTTSLPGAYYCKGNYYALAGRSPFARLIYPVPERAGLGVHVTVDLARPAAASAPTPNGSTGSTTTVDPRAGRRVLRRGAQILAGPAGRRPGAGLCRHPAEARPGRRPVPATSSSPAPPSTALRAWSSCSGSRARASPHPGRSPARWRAGWVCRS